MKINHLLRKEFFNFGLMTAGAVGNSLFAAEPFTSSSPNILFIISDDYNGTRGVDGKEIVKTPNLDRLASESFRFKRAYAQATVCNPSRASFLTGRRSNELGVFGNREKFRTACPDLITMPQFFRQSGYYTAQAGKVFHVDRYDPPSWDYAKHWPFPEDAATTGTLHNVTGGVLDWPIWKAVESGTIWDDRILEYALKNFERKPSDKPFFLAVGFIRPHNPFFAPKQYFDMYPLDEIELPGVSSVKWQDSAYGEARWLKAFREVDDQGRKELLRAYYACITYMDAQVGKVLDELKAEGLYDNTIIVFMGDHGYHNWQKDWWGKTTVWELSARAPLMIRVPGMSGTDVNQVVEFVDIYPTLTDLAGLHVTDTLSGRSLYPLIRNPSMPDSEWQGCAFSQFLTGLWAVRTDRFRYCEWGEEGNITCALYDDAKDPDENIDLSKNPEYAGMIEKFSKMLDQQRKLQVPKAGHEGRENK